MKAETTFSLKDQLFNADRVAYFAGLISEAYPSFKSAKYQKDVVSKFPDLALLERIVHMAECLKKHLPEDYPEALNILVTALPPRLDPTKTDDDFGEFILAPFSQFVAEYGCTKKYLKISLAALKEMTMRFSVESAIRYFINAFPKETMKFMNANAKHKNYHVRRLASEGTRPKLPWAQKLNIDYSEPLPILEALFADPTRYVTRSVANHMNDISKLDPDMVIDALIRWKKSGQQDNKEMDFIIRHSLRTLIKQGHPEALKLLGYGGKPEVDIVRFETLTPKVKVGDAFEFALSLSSNKKQNLLIDYQMQFASEDGKKPGQKVFKLKMLELPKGKTLDLKKKHPMRLMTTRRLYAGEHTITLQINGRDFGSIGFELVV